MSALPKKNNQNNYYYSKETTQEKKVNLNDLVDRLNLEKKKRKKIKFFIIYCSNIRSNCFWYNPNTLILLPV